MQQTLDLCKKYVQLDDASAVKKLEGFTLDDIRDTQYIDAANKSKDGKLGTLEKTDVTIQSSRCLRHSLWATMLHRQRVTMMKSVLK